MPLPLSHRALSRRAFALSLGAVAMAGSASAQTAACGWPQWATQLQADLDAMAAHLTATLKPWSGPDRVAEPEDFGHHAGDTLSTTCIQAALDAVAAKGGGTVRLTKGDYISGTIELRDNTRLDIAKGVRLIAALDMANYPERVAKRPTVQDSNMGMNQSLIHAEGCTNIALSGKGMIFGRGYKENFSGPETSGATPGRPFLIRIIDCSKVHVSGLRLQDAACWMQNYLNCEDLLFEDLHVENQANFNNDGFDIDGCRRVIVRRCWVNAEDDAMCFKGASQRTGEYILVEDCEFYSQCNAIKFGTDSQGDFRNVLVRRCTVGGPSADMNAARHRRADGGISWESVDGGTVENILAHDIHIVRTKTPLFLRLGDRGRVRPEQARPVPGRIRRIAYANITGDDNGSRGSYFTGLPGHVIEDIAIRDVNLTMEATDAPMVDETKIGEFPSSYPDPFMIGSDAPAYGLWTRHLRNLTVINFNVATHAPDPRPKVRAVLDTEGVCQS